MTSLQPRRLARVLTATALACGAFAALGAAGASAAPTTITVCPAGSEPAPCDYTTIQAALPSNPSKDPIGGDTILVGPGEYTGPVDVNQSVTIEGDGAANTTIVAPGSALTSQFTTGSTSNDPIVYADAANVTIEDLTVDGEDSGNASGNRFEGIAADNNSVTVNDVTVEGIADNPYDGSQSGDGIYVAATDGLAHTATITNNQIYGSNKNGIAADGDSELTVDIAGNTVVDPGGTPTGSNGIEVFDLWWASTPGTGPKGTITDNTVSGNDCTLGQPSCGSDLLSDSSTGGNDDAGGDSAGLLLGQEGDGDGNLTVSGNTVTDSDVGVWADAASGSTVAITANTVTDNGYADVLAEQGNVSITSNTIGVGAASAPNLAGVLVASYSADGTVGAHATITANTISGTDEGIEIAEGETQSPPAPTPTATISDNAIYGNTTGIDNTLSSTVAATDNWFGCNGGPPVITSTTPDGCDTVSSHVTATPFLILAETASPSSITTGATSTVTASLRQDSAGATFPTGTFPSGVTTTFATNAGSVGSSATLANGTATTTLSGTPIGSAAVTGTLDHSVATTSVLTSAPATTTTTTTTTVTVTVPSTTSSITPANTSSTSVAPLIAFLPTFRLSLLAEYPGSALTVFCADGCSANVTGKIKLSEKEGKHVKHGTLVLMSSQLTIAADSSSVYSVVLSNSQRTSLKRASSATVTLNVSATDAVTGKTTSSSHSFLLSHT